MRTPPILAASAIALALVAAPASPAAGSTGAGSVTPAARGAVSAPAATVRTAATKQVSLSVDAGASRHSISPLIYGINFASRGVRTTLAVPVDRWGGNSTSRYNYTNHTSNTGSDYYFENIVAGSGETLDAFVTGDRSTRTASLVTVPMIGWVSKNSPAAHPFLCSFPRTTFPDQDGFDYWDPDCGTGTTGNGATQLTADPTTTSIAVGADFDRAMVASLVSRYGTASAGGVRFYELDNEPDDWNSTHRDVHPDALTSDELWAKSKATSAAVKTADPSAKVLGPSDWGWCAYYYSAADECGQSTADQTAHGGLPLGAWYLKQFAAAQRSGGTRLLDYFDEHFYPQGTGIALSKAGSSATQAKRLRSTRSLWDPTYVDESWISDANGGTPLAWLRTMRSWVTQYYPGTKTAITEYNWGGLESMNGALTQADVLGIFGREGLDLATLWDPGTTSQPWAYAFRMYRDGAHRRFGDTSVKAASSDQGRLADYAAVRSSDGALTVMVINKTGTSITSTLTLKGFSGKATASGYRYSAKHPHSIVRTSSQKVRGNKLATTYPASSITLWVVPKR